MATLNLPTAPRTSVFRYMDGILRADPTLSATMNNILSWTGQDSDAMNLTADMAPVMRLTPLATEEVFKFPNAMVGDQLIKIELGVIGYDYDDILNLWWAIERACYPSDPTARAAVQQGLFAAGGYDGYMYFQQPAYDELPENQFQLAVGMIRVRVLLNINT
jgi:hypothetical protein